MIKHLPNFPEEFWPPVNSKDYRQKCLVGLQRASKMDVLIVGCVRDAEPALERNLACLDHMRKFFRSSSVFLFENDSKDSTKNILENYCGTRYNSSFKSETRNTKRLADKSLERRVNMAYARNKYLEYAKSYKQRNIDVIIILDLDLKGGYSYIGLMNSFYYINNQTCIGSNSIYYQDNQRLYYDTWAYEDSYKRTEEEKNLMIFHRAQEPFEVKSCFGGLMVYPSSILKHNIKYESWSCDHVTLHKQLKELNYKILLNPSQITLYSDHYYV